MAHPTETPHVYVIGSLNIDHAIRSPRCPEAGETILAISAHIAMGGKGANQAAACGRALMKTRTQQDPQIRVSMLGAVGKDDKYYHSIIKPTLQSCGVSTECIQETADADTGAAYIIVEEAAGGENRILVVPGANHSPCMGDVTAISARMQDSCHPKILVLQGEIPRNTVLALLEKNNEKRADSYVIFNPAPVFTTGIPLHALRGTAVLIMNETESKQVLRGLKASLVSNSENTVDAALGDIAQLAHHIHEFADVRIVIITLGSRGVYFSSRSGKSGHVEGVKVQEVKDTTAAGDTFVGYFTSYFAAFMGKTGATLASFDVELEAAVSQANRAAAICVQRAGAASSIPYAYELIA